MIKVNYISCEDLLVLISKNNDFCIIKKSCFCEQQTAIFDIIRGIFGVLTWLMT